VRVNGPACGPDELQKVARTGSACVGKAWKSGSVAEHVPHECGLEGSREDEPLAFSLDD
jgi:hypothetical protein